LKEFIIGKNDYGQRLDRFLTKQGLTIGVIRKALRKKDIKVNGKRGQADYILNENDVIRAYLALNTRKPQEKFHGVSANINIVYEDENIILIDKPVGLLCHDRSVPRGRADCTGFTDQDTLINRTKAYLYKKGGFNPENEHSFEPALCNRIDRNTAGIVIAAKNAQSLRAMNEKIKQRQIKKLYLCILTGVPKKKEATLTAFLEKNECASSGSAQVKISSKKTDFNKTIVTKYRILGERSGLALAEIDLITGRTHQIRAHMASIGFPLLGDGKYGTNKVNKLYGFDKQALCSYKLVFESGGSACCLDYLSGKSFKVNNVWFLEKYYAIC
jgi:23S rRNA pseudouridine955/2504/2580 synthase